MKLEKTSLSLLTILPMILTLGAPTEAGAACGSGGMIPHCGMLNSCASGIVTYTQGTEISTTSSLFGACSYGQLRAESIDSSTGRRSEICLNIKDAACSAGLVCRQLAENGTTGGNNKAYALKYYCVDVKIAGRNLGDFIQ